MGMRTVYEGELERSEPIKFEHESELFLEDLGNAMRSLSKSGKGSFNIVKKRHLRMHFRLSTIFLFFFVGKDESIPYYMRKQGSTDDYS